MKMRRDKEILGGEMVFAGTRISVHNVGRLRSRGESYEALRQDFPELSDKDIESAASLVVLAARLVDALGASGLAICEEYPGNERNEWSSLDDESFSAVEWALANALGLVES